MLTGMERLGEWLSDLCRDIMWARARVLVEAGWFPGVGARYIVACPHSTDGIDTRHTKDTMFDWSNTAWEAEPGDRRIVDLDGEDHIAGETSCCSHQKCRRCGGRVHTQGAYGCLLEVCEDCPADAHLWRLLTPADDGHSHTHEILLDQGEQ